MKINLKQLFEIVGEKQEFSLQLDFSEEELYDGHPFQSPVDCAGKIENRAGVVRLVFCVKFSLCLRCDRCFAPLTQEFSYRFAHVLVQRLDTGRDGGDREDGDFVVCENQELDLDLLTRDDILLELPTKILCSEGCKGLCDQCGKNLNEGECGCDKKEADPRLAVLSQLLDSMEKDSGNP